MDIRTFLTLSTEERMDWVENLVVAQNPRLRKGERMTGPVGVYQFGRTYVPRFETPEDFVAPDVGTVQAKAYLLNNDNIDGHPFLDIDVGSNNYLNLYEVVPSCIFGTSQVGDIIKTSYGRIKVDVVLTQELMEQHTTFLARFALSK